jgi:hypothetical protein
VRGGFESRERNAANRVGLLDFFERPTHAHVTRKSPPAIWRAFKGCNGDGHGKTFAHALYGAKSYLAATSEGDRQYLGFDDSLDQVPQQQWLLSLARPRALVFRSNELSCLHQAVVAGVGLGAIPAFHRRRRSATGTGSAGERGRSDARNLATRASGSAPFAPGSRRFRSFGGAGARRSRAARSQLNARRRASSIGTLPSTLACSRRARSCRETAPTDQQG